MGASEVELELEPGVARGRDVVDGTPRLERSGRRASAPADILGRVRERGAVAQRRVRIEHVEDVGTDVDSLAAEADALCQLDVDEPDPFTERIVGNQGLRHRAGDVPLNGVGFPIRNDDERNKCSSRIT